MIPEMHILLCQSFEISTRLVTEEAVKDLIEELRIVLARPLTVRNEVDLADLGLHSETAVLLRWSPLEHEVHSVHGARLFAGTETARRRVT